MPWGAVVGAAIIGAYGAYSAAKKGAEGAENAAKIYAEGNKSAAQIQRESLEFQKSIYADYSPFLKRGLQNYQNLLDNPDAYKKTPGYKFRLQEGLKSIGIADGEVNQRNLSGSQLKAISRYTQDYATNDYDQALRREAGMADLARGTVSGASAAVSNASNSLANTYQQGALGQAGFAQNAANARSAGILGLTNAASQGLSNYGAYRQLNNGTSNSGVVAGDAYQPANDYYQGR